MKKLLSLLAAILMLATGSAVASAGPPASAAPEAPPSTAAVDEVIVDNPDATVSGGWTVSRFRTPFYGDDYLTKPKGTGSATVRWTPDVKTAGVYGIYVWLPNGWYDRATDAPFRVHDAEGDQTFKVDQTSQTKGGTWQPIGNAIFAAGKTGYIELSDQASGVLIADAVKLGAPVPDEYVIDREQKHQTILGIGVEIQSDSIGSKNLGLPDNQVSVPHDLVPSERDRLATEMLSGFRYLRMAQGLYLRGTTDDGKNFVERWDTQIEELADMVEKSGIEGLDVEYWSAAPAFKDNKSLINGTLATPSDPAERDLFYEDLGNAMARDVEYLNTNGLPVKMWSLQNEPTASHTGYSTTSYSHDQYFDAFRAAAPKIKAIDPDILIHGDSHHGQGGIGSKLIREGRKDASGNLVVPPAIDYLDGWSHHMNNGDADEVIRYRNNLNSNTAGKVVFNSEWEFLDNTTSEKKMVQTANSIMNWMTFVDAPTWYWLHALKPTYNAESEGYGLGLWRPSDDQDFSKYAHIQPGHWDYLRTNWNGVAPFVKHMPWDSTRVEVSERVMRADNRIMAWETPDGDLGFALTNRGSTPFRFSIDLGSDVTIEGHHYDKDVTDQALAERTGQHQIITVPPYSIQLWEESDDANALAGAALTSSDAQLQPLHETSLEVTGTLADGTAADLAGASISYASSDPSVASIAADGTVTAVAPGSADLTAEVTLDGVTVETAPAPLTVTTAPSSRAPAVPAVSTDQGWVNGLRGGSYTVKTDVWWGDNALRYTLYENGVAIDSKALTDASPSAQSAATVVSGRANGTYTYEVELTNLHGTTRSTPHVVRVTDASPGVGVLSSDNWDGDGAFAVDLDLWWGTNATEYRLYENDVLVDTQALSDATPNAQHARTAVSGRSPGRYVYRADLANAAGVTSTQTLTVDVTR